MNHLRFRAIAIVMLLASMIAMAFPFVRPVAASDTPDPTTVTIPGTIQSVLGCPADWQPSCQNTYLTFKDGVWQATFDIPAGSYEYKVALNDKWDENYGARGARGGANIPLKLTEQTKVTFIYDHKTHAIVDSVNGRIVVAVGTFQSELGCAQDNDPTCLASWLQDGDGDGLFTFVSSTIPAGGYEVNVALDQTLDTTYSADGTLNGAATPFTIANTGDEFYVGYKISDNTFTLSTNGAPKGNIAVPKAYWAGKDSILWNVTGSPKYTYELVHSPNAGLELTADGIQNGEAVKLEFSRSGPADGVFAKFPHLQGQTALRLTGVDDAKLRSILKGQVAVQAKDDTGKVIDATGLQIPGALDDLFAYDGDLGVTYAGDVPTIRVWAPTARNVTFLRYSDGISTTAAISAPMTLDEATGVWSIQGAADWTNQYYLFDVDVYVPSVSKFVVNRVSDPYSFSLSTNSTRSQIVNLNDAQLKPAGWDELKKPELAAPEDIVLYELHIRDFSITDQSVPENLRGTYKAFTLPDSNGMQHLATIAKAGVTHVHLLPAFDIATIEEDRTKQIEPDFVALTAMPADSEEQQATINPNRDKDGFNWGYDPYHYTTPEGSYSTNPEGTTRIVEFREMVQGLNTGGLRVVMDVVYNHTNSSGQSERSVLDKVVPGYYHRLNAKGEVESSTCCANTATEHRMMEKLMLDSIKTWATQYKIDGFRFDLMGHHMKSNMVNLRAMLDGLTLEKDGVDGKSIYVYGEGWDFGEVAKNARGTNGTQVNMAGTGIGTFNDRLRDAVRGGGPFSGFQDQGFATGLVDSPNGTDQGSPDKQRTDMLQYTAWIQTGLAGNLKDYPLINEAGETVLAGDINYRGAPTGYNAEPQEHIVYVSAHDNETLFDAIQAKAPADAPLSERVRMHNLAMSIVALAQGVPFFHAGDDLLRSKSLDRNSYNSGDWFNRIDWTGKENTWGSGLPPAGDNQEKWPLIKPLLADSKLKPTDVDMAAAEANFLEMVQIRKSSPLFRLQTADQVKQVVSFGNTGANQILGMIVMNLDDTSAKLDPTYDRIVVFFNGTNKTQTYSDAKFANAAFALHPVQDESVDYAVSTATFDSANGAFSIPARSTIVFVQAEGNASATPVPAVQATATAAPASTPASDATAVPAATPQATPAPASSTSNRGIWFAIAAGALLVAGAAIGWLRRKPQE